MKIQIWVGGQSEHHTDLSSVYLPTMSGMMGILVDHCSMVSVLAPGVMSITPETGPSYEHSITGGLMAVHDNTITIWTAGHGPVNTSQ